MRDSSDVESLVASAMTKASAPFAIRVSTVFLLALLALGLAVHAGQLVSIDPPAATMLRSLSGSSAFRLARTLGRVGSAQVWDATMLLIAAGLYLGRQKIKSGLLALGVATAEACTIVVKALVTGPQGVVDQVVHLRELDGFPSGHVVRVVVTLGILAWIIRSQQSRVTFMAGASVVGGLLMGWARIETWSHSPSDVVGAYLLSAIVLNALVFLTGRPTPKGVDSR